MTTETITINGDPAMLPDERIIETLMERAKRGHRTPDDVIINVEDWGRIARMLSARIEHQHGGKTFDDRWIFLHTIVGPFRLFASPTQDREHMVLVTGEK